MAFAICLVQIFGRFIRKSCQIHGCRVGAENMVVDMDTIGKCVWGCQTSRQTVIRVMKKCFGSLPIRTLRSRLVSVVRRGNHQSTTSSPAAFWLCVSKSCSVLIVCSSASAFPLTATHNGGTSSRIHEHVQLHRRQGWFQSTVLLSRVAASSTNQCSDWHACRYGPMCLKEASHSTYGQPFSDWTIISSVASRHNLWYWKQVNPINIAPTACLKLMPCVLLKMDYMIMGHWFWVVPYRFCRLRELPQSSRQLLTTLFIH